MAVHWILAALGWLAFVALLPFVSWMLAFTVAAYSRRRAPAMGGNEQRSFCVLIPAHDEALGIARTLASVDAITYPADRYRVVVIADNCTDDTADIAASCGAQVLRRDDPAHRSKGYALAFAIAEISAAPEPPDAFVIIDADTRIDDTLLHTFAAELDQGHEWIQAYYNASNPDASVRTRLLTYGLALHNGVRLMGQESLGLSCALRGNGMCCSRFALERVPWRAYGLTEDLEFGWHLRLAGERVWFTAQSRVYGEMVSRSDRAARSQLHRWECGRRGLKHQFAAAIRRCRSLRALPKLAYSVDLFMPSMARLGTLIVFMTACVLMSGTFHIAISIPWLVLGLYGVAPFVLLGLSPTYALALLFAPVHGIWKLSLLFQRSPSRWYRTRREQSNEQSIEP